MKDSKEKEHRISNLKDMLDNIQNEENDNDERVEEESINLFEDDEEIEIDDEFIYHPGKEDNIYAVNLDDEEIDENFIIKTEFDENEILKNLDYSEEDEEESDFEVEIGENFDNILNAKIAEKPLLAIISLILGIICIILAIAVFNAGTDRIIDNVVSGENSFIMVIFLIIGVLLLIYGIYRIFEIKSPLDSLAKSINDIEKEPKKEVMKDDKEEEIIIPKSNIPLDKESYKIGEFDMDEIRKTLQKPTPKKQTPITEENPTPIEKTEEKKEYDKAQLDNESIDDIFASVEDIDDIPIISVDSKENKKEK